MIRRLLLLILSVVMGSMTMNAQCTLDLTGEKPSLIKGKNTITIDKSKDKENKYIIDCKDSITINKIVFAKDGKEPKSLVINIGDSVIMKKEGIKNYIPKEIKISPKEKLIIKWGQSNWTFKMKEKALLQIENTKTEKKSTETQDSSNNFMYIVGGLVVFFIGFLVGGNIHRLCRLFKRNKKGAQEQPKEGDLKNNNSDNNGSDEEKAEGNDASSDEESENAVEGDSSNSEDSNEEPCGTTISIDIKNALDDQIAIIIKGYEDDFFKGYNDNNSIVERLQEILSKYFNLLDDQKNISKALSIKEDSDKERILSEIKTIKSELSKYKSKEGSKNDDNKYISVSKLENLIKTNEISKTFYDDTTGDFENRFKELLKKLYKRIKNSIDTTSNGVYEQKKYVIEQLDKYGLGQFFAPNTTLESGIEKIKAEIEKGQSLETVGNTVNINNAEPKNSYDIESIVKELHSQIPDISDSISSLNDLVKDIQNLVKQKNDVDKTDSSSSSENIEEKAINNFLKKIGIQPNETQEDAIKQIEEAIAKRKELDDICRKYEADNGKELYNAIKEHIYKSVKGLLVSKVDTKDIIANCHTTEGIVKELSEAYTEVGLRKQKLEDERNIFASNLKEVCANEGNIEPFDDSDLNAIFNAYRKAVGQKANTAKEQIVTLEKEKEEQKDIIETNNATFNNMRSEMLEVLNQDIISIQESIHRTFIRPCDMNLKSQSDDNQSLLCDAFKKFEKRLQDTKTISSYDELYHDVQKIIEEDIVNEYGLINVLARYYAYSCLPFMTDQAREYGMRIDHESMMFAYNALVHFTNRFGLQLIVPNLFADRITDGDYKDCTGEKYGDLENMCPGVANFVLEISNSDKQHYITDLVRVGYKKNYEVKQKAMVIVAQ